MSSATPPLSPQPLLGCNASSLHGRGGLLMLYMVDEVLRQAFIIIGIHSISIFPYCQYSSSLNRKSCSAVIQRYYSNSAPPYQGFNAEEHARTSFAAFQASGQLPAGLFSPASLQLLDGSPVPTQSLHPITPQRRGMMPTSPSSRTTVNPPLLRTPRTPVRAAPQVQSTPQTPIRPTPQMRGYLGSTSNSPLRDPLSPMRRNIAPASVVNPLFYVVIEGDAPGVYGSQCAFLFIMVLYLLTCCGLGLPYMQGVYVRLALLYTPLVKPRTRRLSMRTWLVV